MKNNCDVSGITAECKGEKNCMYVKKNQDCIFLSGYGTICNNMTAIRAAIEAERMETIGRKIAAIRADAGKKGE